MSSNYRRYGLSKEVDPNSGQGPSGNVFKLVKQFSRIRTKSNAIKGFFFGVDALKKIVNEIEKGDFDGLRVLYGQNDAKEIKIIVQPIKFDTSAAEGDDSSVIQKTGNFYTSVQAASPEPPVAEHPPLPIGL